MTQPIAANELGQLLDEHAAALELFASQWTNSPDDCIQEAMVELAALPAKPENSVAWLYRVVRHRALNNLRSQARRAAREKDVARSDACQMDPSINMQEDDERARITNVLDGLSAEQRELVVLRIWSGLGWREIEDLTGVPSSTAHRRYTAALETMKRQLETKCPTNPS